MARFTLQMDDFEISMYLGLHAFEKRDPQKVIISATIETQIDSWSDKGFYDYDEIGTFLRSLNGARIRTQEELAEKIHAKILENPKALSAVVHTRKPDVFKDAASVGLIYGLLPKEGARGGHVVQLDELEITMFLGIHDYEKATQQRVLVSATIVTDVHGFEAGGFYDYDPLVDFIRGIDGTAIETQEELLEKVHSFIMSAPHVTHALVHTRKPDIYSDARAIGIILGDLPFPYIQTMTPGSAGIAIAGKAAA